MTCVLRMAVDDCRITILSALQLQYVANTHVHADHVTGSGAIKTLLKPAVVESIISSASEAKADIHVKDGDIIEVLCDLIAQILYYIVE